MRLSIRRSKTRLRDAHALKMEAGVYKTEKIAGILVAHWMAPIKLPAQVLSVTFESDISKWLY
jgi:hypothetical protein